MGDSLHVPCDQSWVAIFSSFERQLDEIEKSLHGRTSYPPQELVFRAFTLPLDSVRVVIFGQDPYPTPGNANGYAFAVPNKMKPPASLRNIFKEYQQDLGKEDFPTTDLAHWSDQGVLLLNRALTYSPDGKVSIAQWSPITDAIAQELGRRDVVAILWGSDAKCLKKYFREDWVIESAHPSPLSAYRGFFGSKPFSRTNQILEKNSLPTISW